MVSNKVGEYPEWLVRFVAESNRIEGIKTTTDDELKMTQDFIGLASPGINDVKTAALVFTRGEGELRSRAGMNVRIGNHLPPQGGPMIAEILDRCMRQVVSGKHTPLLMHYRFEALHPFMDGNGRTGRLLWAWQMEHFGDAASSWWRDIGFLHTWYYQSLSDDRVRSV